ncbi:MAG TPA: polyprenyl synthetase family protein, partial [Thermoleophilaceae bacterium]|nr:polyprenyl synthetase family protein [Thermoleophilaceae bacterium]
AALPPVGAILAAGGPELAGLMERAERRLAEIAESHGTALERHAALTLSAGGKRMRPLLVFLCAGGTATAPVVSAAVSVELLHMATLVHDDVLDRAELRRGRPTVFTAGGRAAATATGDFLFSRAFAELASTGSSAAVRALSTASSALARGELMQRADAFADDLTADRYLERCTLKTARLFQAACYLGALLGGLSEPQAEALAAYGTSIGLAFQILDDVLDVEGPVERTGKHRGTDLLDGTVTLPLILARERDPGIAALDLRSIAGPAEAARVCEQIAATGALGESRRRALAHVDEAKGKLRGASLGEHSVRVLDLVADGVVERYA